MKRSDCRESQRFGSGAGRSHADRTWNYDLLDASTANIRALVADPAVEDTDGIDRQAVSDCASRGHHRPTADRLNSLSSSESQDLASRSGYRGRTPGPRCSCLRGCLRSRIQPSRRSSSEGFPRCRRRASACFVSPLALCSWRAFPGSSSCPPRHFPSNCIAMPACSPTGAGSTGSPFIPSVNAAVLATRARRRSRCSPRASFPV